VNNPYFASTQLWRIPEAVIQQSLSEMACDGVKDHEGIVLWLGKDTGEIAEVTHLIRLRGPLVEKRRDFINIDPVLLNDVADVAIEQGLRLVGQVHTHGPGYRLDLSETDRDHGIQAPSYLSLVAPDYGRTDTPVHDWGVHVFMPDAGYVRLSRKGALRRLQLIEGPNLPMLTAGDGS
jgi:proteasome lid subunit RPN8/RPN11